MSQQQIDQGFALLDLPPPSRKDLAHIPGDYGPPIVGRTLDWMRDLFALADNYHDRYGPVAKINIGGIDSLFVVGADNMQAIYLNTQELVSARLTPPNPLSPFYPGALLFNDGEDHKDKRRFMQHAFKSSAMKGYVERINPIAEKHVAKLPSKDKKPVFPLMKAFLSEVAASIFFGLEDDDPMAATLMNDFVVMNEGLMALVKTELPIPGLIFPKAMRANRRIEAYIQSVIAERRISDGEDVLSHLCKATDDNGDWIPDREIVQQAKFLFFAAHDTTSSTMTNMLLFTGINPEWQQSMRNEFEEIVGAQTLNYEHLNALTMVQQVFLETLRFYPAVAASPRIALEGCELSGIKIPAGTPIALVARSTHMLDEHWTNPKQFDPMRFSIGREEHKAHPFQFAPFGGGAHKCIGLHFASMVTKIFYHQLLNRYSYDLPKDYPIKMSMLPLPKPANDLPMQFKTL